MAKLVFLDHVAIRVSDLHRSAEWYEQTLGLKRFQPPEWKPFPIMMLAGESGVALFPDKDPAVAMECKNAMHIAFRVSLEDLEEFYTSLTAKGLDVTREDHHYFQSIYFRDPDGHRLELTAPSQK